MEFKLNMQLSIKKTVRAIGVVLLSISIVLIITFSFFSFSSVPEELMSNDKIAHSIAYTALGFSLFLTLVHLPAFMEARKERKSGDKSIIFISYNTKTIALSITIGTLLGLVIELLQPIAGRNCELLDLAAEFLGLVLGVAIGIILLDMFLSLVMDKTVWYDVMHETEQKH